MGHCVLGTGGLETGVFPLLYKLGAYLTGRNELAPTYIWCIIILVRKIVLNRILAQQNDKRFLLRWLALFSLDRTNRVVTKMAS